MKKGVVEGGRYVGRSLGAVGESWSTLEGGRFISSRRRVRRSCTGGRCVCRSVYAYFGTAGSESR